MIPRVLKRKQIMWLPPSRAKQFGLVHSQASFWATWRGRKVPILRSPLTALRLHIRQISINFYGVCPGAWPKKKKNARIWSRVCPFVHMLISGLFDGHYEVMMKYYWYGSAKWLITSQSLTQGKWSRGTEILGSRSPWRLNLLRWLLPRNICVGPQWGNVLHATLLTPRNLNWVLDLRKICVLLK